MFLLVLLILLIINQGFFLFFRRKKNMNASKTRYKLLWRLQQLFTFCIFAWCVFLATRSEKWFLAIVLLPLADVIIMMFLWLGIKPTPILNTAQLVFLTISLIIKVIELFSIIYVGMCIWDRNKSP